MYTHGHTVAGAKKLPLNLPRCPARFLGLRGAREGSRADVVASYAKLKQLEWNTYAGQLTDWERQTTLDC